MRTIKNSWTLTVQNRVGFNGLDCWSRKVVADWDKNRSKPTNSAGGVFWTVVEFGLDLEQFLTTFFKNWT